MKRAMARLSIAAGLVGCTGQTLNLGPGDATPAGEQGDAGKVATGADASASACPPVPVGPPDADTSSLAALAGVWTGYVENYHFPSGSDAIALTFSVQGDGSVAGTVVFGQGSPPAPPIDFNVGYFPNGGFGSSLQTDVTEGFVYTASAPSLDGTRLRFGIETREVFRSWCEPQTPYLWFANGCTYGCLPRWDGHGDDTTPSGTVTLTNPSGGPNLVVNSGKFILCYSYLVCDCGPSSCTVRLDRPNWTFDVQVTAGHLDGSVGTGNNVHLTGPSDGGG